MSLFFYFEDGAWTTDQGSDPFSQPVSDLSYILLTRVGCLQVFDVALEKDDTFIDLNIRGRHLQCHWFADVQHVIVNVLQVLKEHRDARQKVVLRYSCISIEDCTDISISCVLLLVSSSCSWLWMGWQCGHCLPSVHNVCHTSSMCAVLAVSKEGVLSALLPPWCPRMLSIHKIAHALKIGQAMRICLTSSPLCCWSSAWFVCPLVREWGEVGGGPSHLTQSLTGHHPKECPKTERACYTFKVCYTYKVCWKQS